MKKLISIVVAVCLFATLAAGCGSKTETKSDAEATAGTAQAETQQPKNPVTLQLSIWGNDMHKKMYEDLFAKYKEKNPHVTAEVLTIPFADYLQKLSINKAAGQAPDIAWLSDSTISQFLQTNQLVDISGISNDSVYDFNDIVPTTLDPVKKDGKTFGVAFSTPPVTLFYNKTMFKEKGLKTPMELYKEGKWNYDEFLKAAKALTDKDKGIYGVRVSSDWKAWYYSVIDFVWGFGGNVFSEDGTKFLLNSPEGQQGVQMYIDMIYKDEVHPKPGDQSTFESGKNAMNFAVLSYVGTAKKITDFEWDIAPLPEGPKGSYIRSGYAAYTIFNIENNPKADETLELFKYLTNKDSMTVTAQYFVPSRKSVLSSDTFKKLYPENMQESLQTTVLERLNSVKVPTVPQSFAKVTTEVQIYFDMLYAKGINVKDALTQAEDKVAPLMK